MPVPSQIAGRPLSPRLIGLAVALLLEALLIALLLSLGWQADPEPEPELIVVDFKAQNTTVDVPPAPEPAEAPAVASPAPAPVPSAVPRPSAMQAPAVPSAVPPPAIALPNPAAPPVIVDPAPAQPAPTRTIGVRMRGQASGPPNVLGAGGTGDTPQVGTAPNGEALYAAAWYRRPLDNELAGYLSTATGPGWGLIACKTVPDFRVEDCALIDESPDGSNIGRAVLAAAWQFRVRPPRKGGQLLVGAWVRIRIDYDLRRP